MNVLIQVLRWQNMKKHLSTILILMIGNVLACSFGLAQDASLELVRAKEKARTTKRQYESLKRLSALGSASEKDVRDANLMRKLALLEVSDLMTPERKADNSLLRAKIVFQYRTKELNVVKKLYQSGSVSGTVYRRSVAAYEVADARLKAVESITETQKKIQLIKAAKAKFAVAQEEHTIASRLFQSGSISKDTMSRATSNLEIAKSELAQTKKSLGATAFQVQQ